MKVVVGVCGATGTSPESALLVGDDEAGKDCCEDDFGPTFSNAQNPFAL